MDTVQRPAWVDDELFPFESRFVDIDGNTVHYLASHLMGGSLGRLLIRQFNLFVNAMIPVGHRLRRPAADEMAHYRGALALWAELADGQPAASQ